MSLQRLEVPTHIQATEALINSYSQACTDSPFNKRGVDRELGPLIRARVEGIRFAPYWRSYFVEGSIHPQNYTSLFAERLLEAAKREDGEVLMHTAATALGNSFGEHTLIAKFETPKLEEPESPQPLAQFLIDRRTEFDDGRSFRFPPTISPSWIRLTHRLASEDPARHAVVLEHINVHFREASHGADVAAALDNYPGGYGVHARNNSLKNALASTLADFFPEIVVSELKDPPQKD